ncbi:hypothetical protein [Clostridium tertium]|uniref:hypothetical protein n=1 Tax=Clostridium tertium TaxID=1559 RepID=UPI0023B2BF39|nr:hypothetical protein [Clostridium tertium]
MSHYLVAVILDGDEINKVQERFKDNEIKKLVEQSLEPFDEDIQVEPYISRTCQELETEYHDILQAIEKNDSSVYNLDYILRFKDNLSTFEGYAKTFFNCNQLDADYNYISTYNPKSKWDWYEIGGRWSDLINDYASNIRESGSFKVQDIVKQLKDITYAVLTKDGKWHEPGEMLWFGISSASEEQKENFDPDKIIREDANRNDYIVLVDCHI